MSSWSKPLVPDWLVGLLVVLGFVAVIAGCYYAQYRYDLFMAERKGEAIGRGLRRGEPEAK